MKRMFLTLLLGFAVAGVALAQRTVVGTVTGDDGETLVGASIGVKGAAVGARADADGRFSLIVPSGYDVLVIAYTGYTTQEVTLGASNVLNVVLAAGTVLQETVVTALGISRSEKALGYSVTQVEGSVVEGSGEVNVVQGLAAKTSGVQVIGSAGTPGASSKILIRGNSSFQLDNQPLIVIDNVPYNNAVNTVIGADYPFNPNLQGVNESNRGLDINPADIENISVLKGPAASALYGTRAANGVILITTKKGKKGLQVSYGSTYEISQVNKLPDVQSEFGQGGGGGVAVVENGIITGSNPEGVAQAQTPNSWGPRISNAFDNFDTYFQNGEAWVNNFSVAGGTDNTTFRFSYGNASQTGIIPNTELKRNTFRLNATTGVEQFKITTNATYSATNDIKAQNGSNLSGIMLPLLRMPADFDVAGGTGEGGYENRDGSQHTYLAFYDNPLWTAYNNPNFGSVGRFTGAISLDYTPKPWLGFTVRVGTDMYNDKRKQLWAVGNNNFDPRGEVWNSNLKHEEVNADFIGRFNKSFGDISTSVTVGSQLNQRKDESIFSRGTNFAIPDYYNMNNASILYSDNSEITRRIGGVFATADIGYKFIYLTVGARNDWASTFGPAAKNSFIYPNASLSFIVSDLIPINSILSYLKVRGSFAQAGREPTPYSSRTYFTQPNLADGFTNVGLGAPYLGQNLFNISTVLGNSGLRPEINTAYEGGFDARLLKNRLNVNFTYYISKSTDLIIGRPIASASGFSFFTGNVGEMENRGIELEADYDIVKTKTFNWNLGGNFTRNRNKVLKLAEGVPEFSIENAFTGIGAFAIEGQPYGAIFGSFWQRDAQGRMIIGANGLPVRAPGQKFLGNPYPDWTAAVRNSFSFKGLSLTGLLDIRQGGALWNGTGARMHRIGRTKESGDGRDKFYVVDGVKADGTPNDIRISAFNYFNTVIGDGAGSVVENAIQDGSWVRLRELTLRYSFPKVIKQVNNLSLFVTGRNLWLQTKYDGVDPETSLTGAGSNVGGFDYFNMPGTKSVIFGLNASF